MTLHQVVLSQALHTVVELHASLQHAECTLDAKTLQLPVCAWHVVLVAALGVQRTLVSAINVPRCLRGYVSECVATTQVQVPVHTVLVAVQSSCRTCKVVGKDVSHPTRCLQASVSRQAPQKKGTNLLLH